MSLTFLLPIILSLQKNNAYIHYMHMYKINDIPISSPQTWGSSNLSILFFL